MKSSGLLNLLVFFNFCAYDILAKDSYSKDTATSDLKNEKCKWNFFHVFLKFIKLFVDVINNKGY